ncbi:hypothetical protein EVAR_44382_1 [Eumeta japonica]|uniref:Uncharacterized protein n=1 Tax=Eumeta variegata TaxID=151549 RepID=A0A4C1X8C4_EUMVA|nr:hypothetical protein EVAR_44382_1 [Eumeta japonica]
MHPKVGGGPLRSPPFSRRSACITFEQPPVPTPKFSLAGGRHFCDGRGRSCLHGRIAHSSKRETDVERCRTRRPIVPLCRSFRALACTLSLKWNASERDVSLCAGAAGSRVCAGACRCMLAETEIIHNRRHPVSDDESGTANAYRGVAVKRISHSPAMSPPARISRSSDGNVVYDKSPTFVGRRRRRMARAADLRAQAADAA